ncbi:DoxX family protein [Gordonia humi]|uniref:DoxX family protein n=1 Tax=Gordonia humi TaxID=686429 RepID=UPI00361EB236
MGGLAAFRIVVGFLFFCHGASTLFGWFLTSHGGETAQIGAWPSWYAGVIEFVGGLLVMVGWGTRTAALLGAGSMAVAYFWKHQGDGLLPVQNDGESATLFCWALLLLVFLGPGRFALESVVWRRGRPQPQPQPRAASGDRRLAVVGE